MARASFLLRPRWLISHLLVVVLVVVMINLGFWQLDRLDQRRARNEVIEDRQTEPAAAVEDLLTPGDAGSEVDAVRFRTVTATGVYDEEATVVVRNRSQDGAPGMWIVTPLELGPGSSAGDGDGDEGSDGEPQRVAVLRGFLQLGVEGEPEIPPAPAGEVTVTGVVMSPDKEGLGGTAAQDLEPLLAREGVLPGLIRAESSQPPEPEDTGLRLVPPPELGEGPHFSYAMQWFIFSTIAVVGYPLVLRRVVQRRAGVPSQPEEREDVVPHGQADG